MKASSAVPEGSGRLLLVELLLLFVDGEETGGQRECRHNHLPGVRGAELTVRPK